MPSADGIPARTRGRPASTWGDMNAGEIALFLRALISEYRARNGGLDPKQIYASADLFAVLKAEQGPLLALKKAASGYTFDGVPIEPKSTQALPFVLRP